MTKKYLIVIILFVFIAISGCSSLTGLVQENESKQDVLDNVSENSENVSTVQMETRFNVTSETTDGEMFYLRTNVTQSIDFENNEYKQEGVTKSDVGLGERSRSIDEYYKNGIYYQKVPAENDSETEVWNSSDQEFPDSVGDSGVVGFTNFSTEFRNSLEMEYDENDNEYVFTSNLSNNSSRNALVSQLNEDGIAFIENGNNLVNLIKDPESGSVKMTVDADSYRITSFKITAIGSKPPDKSIESVDFTFNSTFSGHNEDVSITVPEEAKSSSE